MSVCGNDVIDSFSFSQQEEFCLKWSPDDLTQQDVASLYSAQTDSWTLIDEFSESHSRMGVNSSDCGDLPNRVGPTTLQNTFSCDTSSIILYVPGY